MMGSRYCRCLVRMATPGNHWTTLERSSSNCCPDSAGASRHRLPWATPPIEARPVTDPDPITQTAAPATLRSDVGAAVGRAWDRAVAAGALARLAGRRGAPGDRDRATRRRGPRRLRQQPRDEARPAVSHGAARHRRGARGGAGRRSRGRSGGHAGRHGRGGATRLPQPAASRRRARVDDRRDPRRPAGVGQGRRRAGPVGQRRVRVGQPDRTAARRERARGVHRRHAQPRPRGGRSAGHPRVLLQRLGRPDPEPGRITGGDQARRTRPRRRLQGRLRRRSRGGTARRRVGRRDRRRTPTPTASSGTGPPDASAKGSRPAWPGSVSASTSGPARPDSTRKAGSSARSSACASAATSTSRTARPGSARPTSATTRTGSSSGRTASRPISRRTSAT